MGIARYQSEIDTSNYLLHELLATRKFRAGMYIAGCTEWATWLARANLSFGDSVMMRSPRNIVHLEK